MRRICNSLYGVRIAIDPRGKRCNPSITRLPHAPQTIPFPARRFATKSDDSKLGDDSSLGGILDRPPTIVRAGRPRGWRTYWLVVVPIISLALGTWQVYRLDWKMKLLATLEDRLVRNPLPLPPRIDPSVLHDFDYRRVRATGHFRHDQEMLLGPRMREGKNGYWVVTPLERDDGASKILVNRGWVAKTLQDHADRKEGLPAGRVTVEGLLREPWKKNFYTLENNLDKWEFYFPDVEQMARITESEPIWVEATAQPDLITAYNNEAKGIPIGRPAEVTIRNNHAQYIFTCHAFKITSLVLTGPQVWIIDCDLRNVLDALTKAYQPKSKDGQLEPKVVAERE